VLLHKLVIKNFKKIRGFEMAPDGNDANIYAHNFQGKTSIMDAYLWLFTGKNSAGVDKFSVKGLDTDGNAIPCIDHEVHAEIEHNGEILTFGKVYVEEYVQSRGKPAQAPSWSVAWMMLNWCLASSSRNSNHSARPHRNSAHHSPSARRQLRSARRRRTTTRRQPPGSTASKMMIFHSKMIATKPLSMGLLPK